MAGYAGGYRDHRDRSPDYTYAGGARIPPSSDHVYDRRPSPRQLPPPYPPASSTSAWGAPPRGVDYEPPNSPTSLRVPRSAQSPRPRSLPPPIGWRSSGSRDGDDEEDYYYRDDRRDRRDPRDGGSRQREHSRTRRDDDQGGESPSPLDKARNLLKDTFSDSTAGFGVGVVGALLGGLAAREAAEATSHHGRHHSQDSNEEAAARRNQALATMVGAAVGALGANAVEKRLELGRDRELEQERSRDRDRGYRRGSRGDEHDRASLAYMDLKRRSGGGGNYEVIERREIIGRPRSGDDYDRRSGGNMQIVTTRPRSKDDFDRRSGSGWDWMDDAAAVESQVSKRESIKGNGRSAVEREIDPEAKSWRNVEDWVYSDGGARAAEIEREKFYRERERRRRSEEQRYRY
ncbi:hypothetical protein PG993_007838 [Apiospora rasikravindrae]|uniref:Glycine zipper domain-containing protein n=1 Tax=Apiospora rasikravindrae TaxID=990691 RepID=A0ABR1SZ02_9PEZI